MSRDSRTASEDAHGSRVQYINTRMRLKPFQFSRGDHCEETNQVWPTLGTLQHVVCLGSYQDQRISLSSCSIERLQGESSAAKSDSLSFLLPQFDEKYSNRGSSGPKSRSFCPLAATEAETTA